MSTIPAPSHLSTFPSEWRKVLRAATQAFDARLGAIQGGPIWTDGLKGAAIIREHPDRAWIASVYWFGNPYPFRLAIAFSPTRSFSQMITAAALSAWIDELGEMYGNKVLSDQVSGGRRPDWPSLGFKDYEKAIGFLRQVQESRLGMGYRPGILYPKRLDGPIRNTSLTPEDKAEPPTKDQELLSVPKEGSIQSIDPNPHKFRSAETGKNRKVNLIGIFEESAQPKIRMQASLMELLARPDIEDIRKVRVGQRLLRRSLMQLNSSRCQVTGIGVRMLLRCSHIKPWALCTKREQLDLDNCLLLAANWDAAFDGGLISFESDGSLVLGPTLRDNLLDAKALLGGYNILSSRPSPRQAEYLAWHREELLK